MIVPDVNLLVYAHDPSSPLHGEARFTADAHIAALAVCHHATVHSADADFGRFPGVRWHDPLAVA